MSLTQVSGSNMNFSLLGDGVTTTATVDCHNYIEADNSLSNKVPTAVFSASGGGSTPSTSLSGTKVTLTWSTAPSSGLFTVTLYLEF